MCSSGKELNTPGGHIRAQLLTQAQSCPPAAAGGRLVISAGAGPRGLPTVPATLVPDGPDVGSPGPPSTFLPRLMTKPRRHLLGGHAADGGTGLSQDFTPNLHAVASETTCPPCSAMHPPADTHPQSWMPWGCPAVQPDPEARGRCCFPTQVTHRCSTGSGSASRSGCTRLRRAP